MSEIAGNSSNKLAIFWHPACEVHNVPSHPEQPGRVVSILGSLRENFPTADFYESKRVTDAQILNAHHLPLLKSLQKRFEHVNSAKRDNNETIYEYLDGGDTVIMHGTEEAIYRAAGAAVQAVDDLFASNSERKTSSDTSSKSCDIAFCCVRPPGHHAEPFRSMGFCFVNNTVVAAEHARLKYGIRRVAILDFDVHHGNGTDEYARLLYRHYEKQQQPEETSPSPTVFTGGFGAKKLQKSMHDMENFAEILVNQQQYYQECHGFDSTDEKHNLYPLFYASTHEREGYPGTGIEVPAAKRAAMDHFVVNRNIPGGSKSREVFRTKWLEIIEELITYDPELVIFSAGFDAHDDDPLADVELMDEDFYWVTRSVLDRLYDLNQQRRKIFGSNVRPLRVMSVLEGGYDLGAIARCTVEHINAMLDAYQEVDLEEGFPDSEVSEQLTKATAETAIVAPQNTDETTHAGDEVAALQASLAELGIQSPKSGSRNEQQDHVLLENGVNETDESD